MNEVKIKLEQVRFPVSTMNVDNYKDDNETTEVSYDLGVANTFDREVSCRHFGVVMKVHVSSSDGLVLNIESHSVFTTDTDITDEFLAGNFPKINAPAIVYPYVRSFISNLVLNGGYKPIILPAVNFVQLMKQKQKEAMTE